MAKNCKVVSSDVMALMEQVGAITSQLEINPELTAEDIQEQIKVLYDESTHPNKKDLFKRVLSSMDLDFDLEQKDKISAPKQLVIERLSHSNFKEIYAGANSAYNYMENMLLRKMFQYTFLNRERTAPVHLIDTADKFNAGIIGFKNNLINIISTGLNIETPKIFTRKAVDVGAYNQLMQNPLVKKFLDTVNLKNASIENQKNIEIFSALYILNNFDILLKSNLNGLISIDQNSEGNLNNQNYTKENGESSTYYWIDDTHEAKSSENFVSNLAKLIISTIQKVDQNYQPIPGRYMSTGDLFMISGLLKQAELEYNILHKDDPISLLSGQKKAIKKLFEHSDELPVFENRFKTEIFPLKQFLYGKEQDLMSVEEVYNEAISNAQNTNNVSTTVSDIIDIESYLCAELGKSVAPTYIQYSPSGNVHLVNLSKSFRLSNQIYDNMLGEIQSQIMINELTPTLRNKIVHAGNRILTLYDISTTRDQDILKDVKESEDFQKAFKTIFGTELTDELLNSTGYNIINRVAGVMNSIAILLEQDILNKTIDPLELASKLDSALNIIQKNNTFSTLSQKLSQENDDTPYTTFDDFEGASIPVYRINSAFFTDSYHLNNYKIGNPYRSKTNLFIDNFHLLSSINNPNTIVGQTIQQNHNYPGTNSIKLDAGTTGNSEDTAIMTDEALFMSDFLGNFISMTLNYNTMSVQPTEYSDKTSVPLKNINLEAIVTLPNGVQKPFGQLTNSELLKWFYYFRKNQQVDLIKNIVDTWSEEFEDKNIKFDNNVFERMMNSSQLSDSDFNYVKTLWNTVDNYVQNWNGVNSKPESVNIVNELHFTKYNKKKALNREIWHNFELIKDFQTFKQWNENMLSSLLLRDSVKTTLDNVYNTVRDILSDRLQAYDHNISDSEITQELSKIPEAVHPEYGFNREALLARYLLINNLISSSFLDLTTKEEYLDKVKKSDPDNPDLEISGRYAGFTKRTVILPGTVENYQQGLINGVPKQIKVAVVTEPEEAVFNLKGETSSQPIFDGSAYISPFYSRLVNNSVPGRGLSGTKKPLGMHVGDYYQSLYKYAEFEINNWRVRNSIGGEFDLEILMKKMHNMPFGIVDLTKNMFGYNMPLIKLTNFKRMFYSDGMFNYEITGLENTGNNNYIVYRKLVDVDGNQITLDGEIPNVNYSTEINSIYDLWKVFGGENCQELVDGVLENSDLNLDVITEYINNVGTYNQETGEFIQPLKDSFVSMVANNSAVKRGIVNENPTNVVWGKNDSKISYSLVNTADFGIQLDANHEADLSELTELSQTISALASQGYTTNLAQEAYDQIAKIIQSNISSLTQSLRLVDNGNLNVVLQQASKDLIETMSQQKSASVAESVARRLQEQLTYILPLSNPNFYQTLTKQIFQDLNRSALKRKYMGLGGVVNPTSNVLQIYTIGEKQYLKDDLIREARKHFNRYKGSLLNVSTEDLIKGYIYDQIHSNAIESLLKNDKYQDAINVFMALHDNNMPEQSLVKTTKDKIRILETVKYNTITDPTLQTIKLNNIQTYLEFKNNPNINEVYRDLSIPRDLAPQEYTWEEITPDGTIEERNIWEGDILELNLFAQQGFKNHVTQETLTLREDGNDIINKEC